jgi:Xaa-Pro aminopeptidase
MERSWELRVSVENHLAALRARLATEGVYAIALTYVPNVRYATGLPGVFDEEPAHVALVTAESATLFTDSRFATAATMAAAGGPWRVGCATDGVVAAACDALRSAGVTRLALESTMPHGRFLSFTERFGGEVVSADGWVETLRAVKDPEEIASIEAAQALTDRAFDHLLTDVLRAGISERHVALELEVFMRREGSEGVAFAPIVASGLNSALPHAVPCDRALASGDLVVLDFGARVDGYCADMTRTVVIGSASGEKREMYSAVLAANKAGIAAVSAGKPGREIDAAARAVIAEAGYGECFGHGLGHGVGLEVHEEPGLGTKSELPVPLGSVVTVEPGVYVPGVGGVRIEDLVVVGAAGARVLTRSAKDLLEV